MAKNKIKIYGKTKLTLYMEKNSGQIQHGGLYEIEATL
jgi:hypothetical protein